MTELKSHEIIDNYVKNNSFISVKLFPFGCSLNTCTDLLPYFLLIYPPFKPYGLYTTGPRLYCLNAMNIPRLCDKHFKSS